MAIKRTLESPKQTRKRKKNDSSNKKRNIKNETEEEKNIRLQKQYQYRMHQKELKKSLLFSKENYSEEINIEIISEEVKKLILNKLQGKLSAQFLDEGVCVVCDRITPRQSLTTKSWDTVVNENCSESIHHEYVDTEDSDDSNEYNNNNNRNTILYAMKRSLFIPRNERLSPSLISHYDCSDIIRELKGLLLSKKGITRASHDLCDKNEKYLQYCDECIKQLVKVAKSTSYNLPPSHEIANHFFIGEMPDTLFNDATWVEQAMTSMVTNVASTRIVRGGQRRSIRSHVLVFGSIPGPPATLLPRKLDDDAHFRIILAGPFTQPQIDRLRQQHLVQKNVCTELLHFYKENNSFYANVVLDINTLQNMPKENNPNDMFDKLNDIDISSDIVDLIDIQQQRVNDR